MGNDAPRPLAAREYAAWRAYADTVNALSAAIDDDLAPTGLSFGDYQVLVFLGEAPDRRMRMGQLAECLQLSPSGLTRRLDGLVRRELVYRSPSTSDGRVVFAGLTDAGLEALDAAYPVHLASVRARVIDPIAHDDLDAVARAFSSIQSALRDDGCHEKNG